MNLKLIVVCLTFGILLSACSEKQVYEAIQQNRQFECQKLPLDQYEECLETHNSEPYDVYKKEKDKVIE